MAYDESLAERIRHIVRGDPGADEKKMFGGIAFLVNGNMACGAHTDNSIVRLAPEDYDDALAKPGAAVFDLTGKPMKGWLLVRSDVLDDDADLEQWVRIGVDFAHSLSPK